MAGARLTAARLQAALLVAATLGATPARADDVYQRIPPRFALSGTELDVLGWTPDGTELLFTTAVRYFPMETVDDPEVPPMRLTLGLRRDVRRGRDTRYVLELVGPSGPTMRDELRGSPGPGEWAAYRHAHPPEPGAARVGPRGAEAVVTGAQGAWAGVSYHFELPARAALTMAAVVGDQRFGEATWTSDQATRGSVTPLWAPDGRRLAWLVRDEGQNVQTVAIVPVGPYVALATLPADADRATNAAQRLEQLGVVPMEILTGDVPAETVIYYAPGFEAEARRLAAAAPGGGRVDTLTWTSAADLAIVAGPALLEGPSAPVPAGRPVAVHGARRSGFWTGRRVALAGTAGALVIVLAGLRVRRRRRASRTA